MCWMFRYYIGQTALNMAPFKHVDMTFGIVSFRGTGLTEGQHKQGKRDKGRAERQTDSLDRWKDG